MHSEKAQHLGRVSMGGRRWLDVRAQNVLVIAPLIVFITKMAHIVSAVLMRKMVLCITEKN